MATCWLQSLCGGIGHIAHGHLGPNVVPLMLRGDRMEKRDEEERGGNNLPSHQERMGYNSAFLTCSYCLLCVHVSLMNFAMFFFLKMRLSTSTSCLGVKQRLFSFSKYLS